MLTKKQKRIADKAFIKCDGDHDECVYAAVEAVLAEQARADGQEQAGSLMDECCENSYFGEPHDCAKSQPTHPPAGDMVERMCDAAIREWPNYFGETMTQDIKMYLEGAMAAALAVAREGTVPKSDYDECVRMLRIESEAARQREGYVSLDDVEAEMLTVFHEHYWHGAVKKDNDFADFRNYVRNRLDKPAERVTVGKTAGNWIVYQDEEEVIHFSRVLYAERDAERYAAGLREELKAGKQ